MNGLVQVGEGLLRTTAAAAILGVSRSMIQKLADMGRLPYIKIGASKRFEPAALRAFIEANRQGGSN